LAPLFRETIALSANQNAILKVKKDQCFEPRMSYMINLIPKLRRKKIQNNTIFKKFKFFFKKTMSRGFRKNDSFWGGLKMHKERLGKRMEPKFGPGALI